MRDNKSFSEIRDFITGFDLRGRRGKDGRLHAFFDNKSSLDNWPDKIYLDGRIYALKEVIANKDDSENAVYA